MVARKTADYLKVVDGKIPARKRGGSAPADSPAPGKQQTSADRPKRQMMPRAPKHFSDIEKLAWKDICKPITERYLWGERLRLWAEGYAVLLAVSRSDGRGDPDFKLNRNQIRLYANDQRQILNVVQS